MSIFGMRLEPGIGRTSRISSPSKGNSLRWARAGLAAATVSTHQTRRTHQFQANITLPFVALCRLTEEMLIRRRQLAGAEIVGFEIGLQTPHPGLLRSDHLGEERLLGVL